MGDNEPKSQSPSLQLQERAQWARELSASCKEGWSQVGSRADAVLSPAGQSFWQPKPREISGARSSTLACGARLSQQQFEDCFSHTLESGALHSSGSFAPLLASGEFAQEPVCEWPCSADTAVRTTGADILGVSPCHMCLL